jgi:hypothetical protein
MKFKTKNKEIFHLGLMNHLDTLFFIFGHVSGGRVTVTDAECRIYIYNYEHLITQQLISAMESPIRA